MSFLDHALDRTLRVRRGEAPRVFMMFAYLMGVVSTFIVSRNVRDTLFLSRADLSVLPFMYVGVAAAVAPASYAYSRVADHFRRDLVIRASLAGFAGVLAVFYGLLHFDLGGRWVYPVLYLSVEIIGAISMIQFWTFANDIYSSREAKRLFGLIGAGGVLSNIACGLAIQWAAPRLGAEALLLVGAGLLLASGALVHAIGRGAIRELTEVMRRPGRSRLGLTANTGTVLGNRHLELIAAIVAVTFLTVSIIDYQFKLAAKQAYSETELSAFFGRFHAFTGIASAFMQFFVTSRLLERRGIVVALALLPVGLAIGAVSMLLPMIGVFTAAVAAKSAENVFRYTINDASTQLLYVPVPSHFRARAKAFIDGILKPMSIGAAGLFLAALGRFVPAERLARDLAYVDLLLIAVWLYLVVAMRSEYLDSLMKTLSRRRLDLQGHRTIDDAGTIATVRRGLTSGDEREVQSALELTSLVDADFTAELAGLVRSGPKVIRLAALAQLSRRRVGDPALLRSVLQESLSAEDDELRAAALEAMPAVGAEAAVEAAKVGIGDRSPRVCAAAVIVLYENGGPTMTLAADDTLRTLLLSKKPELRAEGARVIGAVGRLPLHPRLARLLEDEDASVRVAAIDAMSLLRWKPLFLPLLRGLLSPETAAAALRALVLHGPDIVPQLFEVLCDQGGDLALRRRVPKVIGLLGGEQELHRLVTLLEAEDPDLRVAIARAAAKLRDRCPGVKVDPAPLDRALRRELQEAYQLLAIVEDLALPEGALLPDALLTTHRRRLAIAFRLLEIRYPSRTIQLVYRNLDADTKSVRANALEVADNVLSKDDSRLIVPLLDDHARAEKVRVGQQLFRLERRTREEWIRALSSGPDAWTVACALQHAGEGNLRALTDVARARLDDERPIVRETAAWALARLDPPSPAVGQTRLDGG